MTSGSPAKDDAQGFASLASLLLAVAPEKLEEARRRVIMQSREEMLCRYRTAHIKGKRVIAFLMAEALVRDGVPPFAWHDALALDDLTVNQRYDLFLADVMWLRRWYRDHDEIVRYRRCKIMLAGADHSFHREAEFAFYEGKRPAWKLVTSLSMTERQQWDCALLRSTPIKKRAAATNAARDRVFNALQDDVRAVRRTATFGEAEALATLQRRHTLWRCSRMVDTASPTEIAARFEQMTGTPITRQAVAQQLEKIRMALRKMDVTS
jgi:hypothetical protein